MGVLGHPGDVEHARAERGVRVAAALEDVEQRAVVRQPRQHARLDLGQVTHHQHTPLGGGDGLAQEAPALEVLEVDLTALAGRVPARGGAVVVDREGQRPAPRDVEEPLRTGALERGLDHQPRLAQQGDGLVVGVHHRLEQRVVLGERERLLPGGLADLRRRLDAHALQHGGELVVGRQRRLLHAQACEQLLPCLALFLDGGLQHRPVQHQQRARVHAQGQVDQAQLLGRVPGQHAQEDLLAQPCVVLAVVGQLLLDVEGQLIEDVLRRAQAVTLGRQTVALGQHLQAVAHLDAVQGAAHAERVEHEARLHAVVP